MGDISAWVGIGLTALALTAGCVAYVHAQINSVHNRISSARDHAEAKVAEAKKEFVEDITTERTERRREIDRIEKVLEGFSHVASAVVGMGKSIEHLADSLRSHQSMTDRSLDEVKHTVRAIDGQLRGTQTRE